MRTTVTLDEDVAALIDSERARTGETFQQTVNRLLRRGGRQTSDDAMVLLPVLSGRPVLDVSDAAAVDAPLDDERRAERDAT